MAAMKGFMDAMLEEVLREIAAERELDAARHEHRRR